jgi:predicted TIM-barrel fold metal-dependent hydrolase
MGDVANLDYIKSVKKDYFRGDENFLKNIEPDELIGEMDRLNVEKALVTYSLEEPKQRILEFADKYPGRFFLSVVPDLKRGMKTLWELEALARDYPVVLARIAPFQIDVPPNDAIYYPLYTKCIEMDLPVGINTGICGPPLPSECQNPFYLDRVCHFFPELKIIMQHGADPWWDFAIRLMIKYHNLYMMTSAYAPKYFPPELLHYMKTRGREKIMFASDHPVLTIERCLKETHELGFDEALLENFLFNTADKILFGPRQSRYSGFKIDEFSQSPN